MFVRLFEYITNDISNNYLKVGHNQDKKSRPKAAYKGLS